MTTIHLLDSSDLAPLHCARCGAKLGEAALPLFAEVRILCACGASFQAIHAPDAGFAVLTAAELDVLAKIADGQSNKQIALARGTEESTVKSQVTSVLTKLAADNRAAAVLVAVQLGLVKGAP